MEVRRAGAWVELGVLLVLLAWVGAVGLALGACWDPAVASAQETPVHDDSVLYAVEQLHTTAAAQATSVASMGAAVSTVTAALSEPGGVTDGLEALTWLLGGVAVVAVVSLGLSVAAVVQRWLS